MSRIKVPAGNLIYPPKKILINSIDQRNIGNYFQVIDDSLNSRLILAMPQHGVQVGTDENFTVEIFEGHAGTNKVSMVEILSGDACTECKFEYGFGVHHKYYDRKEHIDPLKHVTNGYYDTMTNPAAIDPLTGLFTSIALEQMNDSIINQINNHVGVHPEAGPVVRALQVLVITRDDADPFVVDITGTNPDTITGTTPALLLAGLEANGDVLYAEAGTDSVTVVMRVGGVIELGASNTSVDINYSKICLEGLYANPYFEVINPKGFKIDVTTLVEPRRSYLTYEKIFDLFFNQQHQGSISQWAVLNQPINSLYIKILIKIASETHAIHGASHTNGYVHVYEIYCPIDLLPVIYDPLTQGGTLPIFGIVDSTGQFPTDSTDFEYLN